MNTFTTNPTYKTGIKTLTDNQIKNGLLGYDLLLSKIDTVRTNASEMNGIKAIDGSYENLKYDNIFSILGGRGAGKTSILLSIYNMLENDKNRNNVLMPLIMPELVDDNDNFIGWILSAMENNLLNIEKQIRAHGYCEHEPEYHDLCLKYKFFDRCVFNRENLLREKYNDVKKAYYARVYLHRTGKWEYSTDFELVSGINDKSFSLVVKFTEYWNALSETCKRLYLHTAKYDNNSQAEVEKNATPLIFFMIDDADLKPQIINELIFSLPKYFSHPNVIVFVSASQKTLSYTVKNFMYQQITKNEINLTGLMNIEYLYNHEHYISAEDMDYDIGKKVSFHELRHGKEYDKICTLTDEILRKLFPVCNRFYLKKYEKWDEKCAFEFENENGKIVELSKQVARKLNIFYKSIRSKLITTETDKNFRRKIKGCTMLNNEENDLKHSSFLSFLGKYPRDIVSGYYALSDMLQQLDKLYDNRGLISEEQFIDAIYRICITFINSIIISNRRLKPFLKDCQEMIIRRKMHWELYINYSMVVEKFMEKAFYNENKRNIEPFLEMICLLNFVERLICTIDKKKTKCHGHEEFIKILELSDVYLIKKSDNIDDMIEQYSMFASSDFLKQFDIYNRDHQEIFLDIVYKLDLFDSKLFKSNWSINKKWYLELFEVMYHRYSVGAFFNQNISEFEFLKNGDFLDDTYYSLYYKYIAQIKELIYMEEFIDFDNKKNSMTMTPSDAYGTIYVMEYHIKALNALIPDLTLCFERNRTLEILNSYALELDDKDYDIIALKRAFDNLVATFQNNNYSIKRSFLLDSLNGFQLLVSKKDVNYLAANSWLYRLTKELEREYILGDDIDGVYGEYMNNCKYIEDICAEYLSAVYAICIHDHISATSVYSVKKMYEIYADIQNTEYFRLLRDKEWRKFIEEV